MTARNWPLLIDVVRHIIKEPDTWDQSNWVNLCGTRFCFAGHAVLLSGYEFLRRSYGVSSEVILTGQLKDVSDDLYGWYSQEYDATLAEAEYAAARLLGLDSDDAYLLFFGGNSLPTLVDILYGWAKEDGVTLPDDVLEVCFQPEEPADVA